MIWRERMQVEHSNMEFEVLEQLNRAGLFPEMDKHFCLQSTVPDFYFPDKKLAVYLDGRKVHEKRQERDQELRRLLKKRHGVEVLSFTYDRNTKKVLNEIVKAIKEALE